MKESIIKEFNNKSKSLYIFFGGINSRIGMPPFEFYNSSKIIGENKIFVRDFSQAWYQSGLKGISKNALDTAEYIKNLVDELNPDNVCFVGNSMGGFAAILFSELILFHSRNVSVIAFSPQTFISPELRKIYGDKRWGKHIFKMNIKNIFNKNKFLDLNLLLSDRKNKRKIEIYVGKDDVLDVIHANHISEYEEVRIHMLDSGGHNIIKTLRDNNQLHEIMSFKTN